MSKSSQSHRHRPFRPITRLHRQARTAIVTAAVLMTPVLATPVLATPAGAATSAGTTSTQVAATHPSSHPGTVKPGTRQPVGPTPKLPAAARSLGALPADKSLSIVVTLAPRDPDALSAFATAVATPGSPSYHRYLAPGQFASRFGADDATVASVTKALTAQGLTVGAVSANRLSLPVTATVGALSKAFATRIGSYRTADGHQVYANSIAPTLPAAVASSVQAVIGLDDLAAAAPLMTTSNSGDGSSGATSKVGRVGAHSPAVQAAVAGPQACTAAQQVDNSYTTDQLASVYDFSGAYARGNFGAGQTVAMFELEPYAASDIAAYQACYHTAVSIGNVNVDGGAGVGAGEGEAALDIEIEASLAPKANIAVYTGPNSARGLYDTFAAIMNQDIASVVSVSWGNCEASSGSQVAAAENVLFQQAAAQGQTVLIASGDTGSQGCLNRSNGSNDVLGVSALAAQPFVTGVGGTAIANPSPLLEIVWNEEYDGNGQGGGAGGGGVSMFWAAPAYQKTYAHVTGNRQVPDVSADADPQSGYAIYHGGRWQSIGGTSAATPLWAAALAMVNAGCTQAIGFANPALYYDFSPSYPTVVGNDILPNSNYNATNNDYTGTGNGQYPVRAGYDMATGWGSPKVAALTTSLCAYPRAAQGSAAPSIGDFNGDHRSDLAVFRPSTGYWYVHGVETVHFGGAGDIPQAADYNGDHRADLAVYRPSTSVWYVAGIKTVHYGVAGDVPVVGDYNGDGRADIALFRPSTGVWYIAGVGSFQWGRATDIPVPGDYNGDGRTDVAVFRPSTGTWYVRGIGTYQWGQNGDVPVVGDFNGDKHAEPTVFRPSTRTWYVRGLLQVQWGAVGDIPVSGDFNGDHHTDVTIFRPSTGTWYVRNILTVRYGGNGDRPV